MCASPFNFLRASPPPPKVALLSNALFFSRTVVVEASASNAEISQQVELTLEGLSPFPVTQLYHGWQRTAGAPEALIFAAYRRRFTTEQSSAWSDAQLVIPTFVTVLAAKVGAGTTILLHAVDGLTAVHWEKEYPSRVVFHPLPPETTEEARAAVEAELIHSLGGSKKVITLTTAPMAESTGDDRSFRFRAGDFVTEISASEAASLDVRDKAELAVLGRARIRDLWLWRTLLGATAALLLLLVGEVALLAANNFWQKARLDRVHNQRPQVEKIMADQSLANSIDELANKPLLPFEMITEITGEHYERKPVSIQFTRVTTAGIDKLVVEGQTHNVADISVYQATLEKLPSIDKVEIVPRNSVGDLVPFVLTVTFKSAALHPVVATAS